MPGAEDVWIEFARGTNRSDLGTAGGVNSWDMCASRPAVAHDANIELIHGLEFNNTVKADQVVFATRFATIFDTFTTLSNDA